MVGISDFNLEELRARLVKMTDAELRKFGRAARNMSEPRNGTVDQTYVLQLKEARLEYRRRHLKRVGQDTLSDKARPHKGHNGTDGT
jgi:hypothetical protein